MGDSKSKKVFVSYKYKDSDVQELSEYIPGEDTDYLYTPRHYVDKIIEVVGSDNIYKGELGGEDLTHLADDTIDSRLKEKIFDSSVTIVLLSPNMWDYSKTESEQWIPNEISYSLRNKTRGGKTSKTNGMLAVALPDQNGNYDYVVVHRDCGVRSWQTGSLFKILRENMFNRNSKNHEWCSHCFGHHHYGSDHSYIHPVKWHDFIADHNAYIDHAIMLRDSLDDFDLTKGHE